MHKIFLKDIVKKATGRCSLAGVYFYYIIIPELSKEDTTMILYDDTSYSMVNNETYEYIVRNVYRYMIDSKFDDTLSEYDIKHSFHKSSIKVFDENDNHIDTVDMYITNRIRGLKKLN